MDVASQLVIKNFLIDETIKEFELQGHHLTGAFEAALRCEIEEATDTISWVLTGKDYGKYLEKGVSANKASFKQFPFVLNYVNLRMHLDEKKAKTVAAMIINKWKKTGMPTPGSFKFSQGSRTGFIFHVLQKAQAKVPEILNKEEKEFVNLRVQNFVTMWNQANTALTI